MGHDFNASIHRRMPLPRGCVVGDGMLVVQSVKDGEIQ